MGLAKWIGLGLAAKGIKVAADAVEEWHQSNKQKKKNTDTRTILLETPVIIDAQGKSNSSGRSDESKCPACGAWLKSDSNRSIAFCPYCGAEIPRGKSDLDKILEHDRFTKEHKEKVRQQKVKEEEQSDKRVFIGAGVLILILVLAIVLFAIVPHRNRVSKLESLSMEIQRDILDNKLDEAWVKTMQVKLDDNYSSDEDKKWNDTRTNLQKTIIEKRGTNQQNCSHTWYLTGNEKDVGLLFLKTHKKEYICSQCGATEWRSD